MSGRDRVLLIVGGASGIGRALAGSARAEGWRVVVMDVSPAPADDEAEEWIQVDSRNLRVVEDAAQVIADRFGGLDAVVITAGVTDPATIATITAERVQDIVDVNVTSAITLLTRVVPLVNEGSSIVLVSSVAALRGGGYFGASTYAASKAALEGLARGLARELAPRSIRVNCIAPGPTATPMLLAAPANVIERVEGATLLGRLGRPDEIAAVAMFLIDDTASFMTGAVVAVDGGASIK